MLTNILIGIAIIWCIIWWIVALGIIAINENRMSFIDYISFIFFPIAVIYLIGKLIYDMIKESGSGIDEYYDDYDGF